MIQPQIILAGSWICVMLIYLLGDVLRIFSGDYKEGMMAGKKFKITQSMWLGISVLMLIPILMIFMSLVLEQPANRLLNIVAAGFFFLFNLVGIPSYPSAYDKFLLLVSLVFNAVTIYYALGWV